MLVVNSLCKNIFTIHNEVAKVMFLHLSASHSVHGGGGAGGGYLGRYPPDQVHPPGSGTPPWTRYTPGTRKTPLGPGTPPRQVPPPGPGTLPRSRRLLLRTVHILLECILVEIFFGQTPRAVATLLSLSQYNTFLGLV